MLPGPGAHLSLQGLLLCRELPAENQAPPVPSRPSHASAETGRGGPRGPEKYCVRPSGAVTKGAHGPSSCARRVRAFPASLARPCARGVYSLHRPLTLHPWVGATSTASSRSETPASSYNFSPSASFPWAPWGWGGSVLGGNKDTASVRVSPGGRQGNFCTGRTALSLPAFLNRTVAALASGPLAPFPPALSHFSFLGSLSPQLSVLGCIRASL